MMESTQQPAKRPYQKSARAAGPFVCCDRSFIDCVGLKRHQQSIAHEKYPRIKTLIESRCVSFKEIGKRIGLSSERVRQIAESMGVTGYGRMGACSLERHKSDLLVKTRLGRFAELCTQNGLNWELLRTPSRRGRFYSAKLIVEERAVLLRSACVRATGYISIHCPNKDEADVIAYELSDGRWMLVPWDQRPPRQTMFAESPCDSGASFNDRRHDYPKMIEAWSIFKKRAAVNAST